MKFNWQYSNKEKNGLFDDNAVSIVGYSDGTVYALCAHITLLTFVPGVSMSGNQGGHWNTVFSYGGSPDDNFVPDICVNSQSGAMLVSYNTDPSGQGVAVRFKDNPVIGYITKAKDGIASNLVNCIAIDEAYSDFDPLGAVYLLHSDVFGLSRYDPVQKRWYAHLPNEWKNAGIGFFTNMRVFNSVIYVGTNTLLTVSRDSGNTWTNVHINYSNLKPKFGLQMPPGNAVPIVYDIYVDELNQVYLTCVFESDAGAYCYVMKSTDELKTWDVLAQHINSPITSLTGKGNNIFFSGTNSVHVWNSKNSSAKVLILDSNNYGFPSVNKIYVDSSENGNIYVPTNAGVAIASLASVDQFPAIWTYVNKTAGLTSNTILSLAGVDQSSAQDLNVYAGGDKGLSVTVDGGAHWQPIKSLAGLDLTNKQFNDLDYTTVTGSVAVGTAQDGVITFRSVAPADTAVRYTTTNGLASNAVSCVAWRDSGDLMVGHLGEGLSRYDYRNNKWSIFTTKNGLAGNYFHSINGTKYAGGIRVYAAGYDMSTGTKRGALSISTAFGLNWKAITQFNVHGMQADAIEVYDVVEDPQWSSGKQIIYACIRVAPRNAGPLWLIQSSDLGDTWTLLDTLSEFVEESGLQYCKPKMHIGSDRKIYLSLPESVLLRDLTEDFSFPTYWEDGMLGHNSGAILIDKNGGLYTGTQGLGVAYSNISYPFTYNG